jgi:iron(III) transport system substrate-binding protein
MKAVNESQVPGAVIYHYYYFGDQAKTGENSGNIGMHYFRNKDPGAFVSISGGGVLAASQHKEQAFALLKWITGPKGQAILRDGDSYEYAIGVGAQSNSKLEPLAKLDPPTVDPATLNGKKVIDLMMQAGLL